MPPPPKKKKKLEEEEEKFYYACYTMTYAFTQNTLTAVG